MGKGPKHKRILREPGEGPPKFEVGNGPCIRPPNILRPTVIGFEATRELTKKTSSGGILGCEIGVPGEEKGVTCYTTEKI